ncbi:hypothetical protein MBLNU230_g8307t1 [Neophaeotheca triangularis]
MAEQRQHQGPPGGKDVSELLKTMSPSLHPDTFFWVSFEDKSLSFGHVARILGEAKVQMLFQEAEGWTAILPRDTQLPESTTSSFLSRMITLNVYSSLEAVGFMKVITERLAEKGLSVNPVSAYFHDHLFVPVDVVDIAMEALREMARG